MNILNRENSSALEKIILKRQLGAATKYGYISLILRVILIVLIMYLILTQAFLITQAEGNSMFPAIKDGDLLIGFRLEQEFAKDDVVIYEMNGERYVGRIVATGSDYITFTENGSMMVNGTTQSQDVLYPTYEKSGGIVFPYTVPKGCVFILGDYRTQSEDSRDFGAVPVDNVVSKVITVMRRRSL